MAGIDTITEEILQDAQKEADRITVEAGKQADAVLQSAREDADRIEREAASRTEKDLTVLAGRMNSQKEMRRRESVLSAKQEIIREIIEQAYRQLADQKDAEYFAMLEDIMGREAEEGQTGEVLLAKRDLDRLPADFSQRVQAAAQKKGGSLTISGEPADIENGFILRYGGIDENCSLRALFEEKREELQDIVNQILW